MFLTLILFFWVSFSYPESNTWRGIVPLRSTRADVEKILGPPTPDSRSPYAAGYDTDNEKVFILYSSGLCAANPQHGWNVPAGVVIRISVEPKRKPRFIDFKLDKSKYEQRPDPEVLDFTYYTNEEEGISVEVNTAEGVVTTVRYSPGSKYNHLRCSTPADSSVLGVVPHKIDQFSAISLGGERKRLEKLRKHLLTYPTTKGYLIVYAGRQTRVGEAQRIAERAKKYLVDQGIYPPRIQLVNGGYRDKWTVELYLIPVGAIPPDAKPTVDENRVQIIGDGKIRNNRSPSPAQLQREPN